MDVFGTQCICIYSRGCVSSRPICINEYEPHILFTHAADCPQLCAHFYTQAMLYFALLM